MQNHISLLSFLTQLLYLIVRLPSYISEELYNIRPILSANFIEFHAIRRGQFRSRLELHFTILYQIAFVGHEEDGNLGT